MQKRFSPKFLFEMRNWGNLTLNIQELPVS